MWGLRRRRSTRSGSRSGYKHRETRIISITEYNGNIICLLSSVESIRCYVSGGVLLYIHLLDVVNTLSTAGVGTSRA